MYVSMFSLSLCYSCIYSHSATLPPPTTCTIPHYPSSSTLQIWSHPPITTALRLPPFTL
ncbi:hypothetical protein CROQUDRAFT_663619, partial [Cronartium quercuum f. sp. fusiforme G11]